MCDVGASFGDKAIERKGAETARERERGRNTDK